MSRFSGVPGVPHLVDVVGEVGGGVAGPGLPPRRLPGGRRLRHRLVQLDLQPPLLRLQLVHPLPQLVDQRLLLLLQRVLQLHLLPPQLVQRRLLAPRFCLQFLDLPHQLIDEALLLLLQRVLQLHLLLAQLVELPAEVVGEALLLLLVVQGQALFLLLQVLDLLEEGVGDELLLLLGLGLDVDRGLAQALVFLLRAKLSGHSLHRKAQTFPET